MSADELPAGWRISEYEDWGMSPSDYSITPRAQHWTTWTERRWFRKRRVTGWRYIGPANSDRAYVVQWVLDTIRAMEAAK